MPDILIRNIPDWVMERLKEQAAAQGISLQERFRQIIHQRAEEIRARDRVEARERRREELRAQGIVIGLFDPLPEEIDPECDAASDATVESE